MMFILTRYKPLRVPGRKPGWRFTACLKFVWALRIFLMFKMIIACALPRDIFVYRFYKDLCSVEVGRLSSTVSHRNVFRDFADYKRLYKHRSILWDRFCWYRLLWRLYESTGGNQVDGLPAGFNASNQQLWADYLPRLRPGMTLKNRKFRKFWIFAN